MTIQATRMIKRDRSFFRSVSKNRQITDGGWMSRLFGAGVDSGTYDYFTEAVVGKEHSSRGDFTSSEDDNVLVQGIATDTFALGFFGVAYYEENRDKLKLVAIDDRNDANGKGPALPTYDNVMNGTYQPLSRPLFIYVNRKSAGRPEVQKFIDFYMKNGKTLSREVGYVALPDKAYELALKRFEKRVTGSVFGGLGGFSDERKTLRSSDPGDGNRGPCARCQEADPVHESIL